MLRKIARREEEGNMQHGFFKFVAIATAINAVVAVHTAQAEDAPRVIKLGQTMPYSGPASTYGAVGRAEAAYFKMINDKGGINGRKVEFLTVDDALSPAKTVEQTRRLVEGEKVVALFGSLGTATNIAVSQYLNQRRVPQLFVASGAARWNDPANFPYTVGWQPSYVTEGAIFAKYVLENVKEPKIAVLYQNDDSGKDYIKGFRQYLGDKADTLIVSEKSYNLTDVNLDTQILAAQQAGANVQFTHANPKFAAQAIQKMDDINWHPQHLLASVANTISGTLKPAGLERSQGIISTFFTMDPDNADTRKTEDYKEYTAFLKAYAPDLDPNEGWVVYGYVAAQAMREILIQAGDDLTRDNIMKQARNFVISPKMVLPGIDVSTSEEKRKYAPITGMKLARFKGESWVLFGDVIDVSK
ncbi:ABC transporter substrate-binding protein [Bradyrhizobium manausense]